ncbi:hypothetical protein [Eubacterium xylanophilum]|uniref:arsenate reductase/protein-tyrosine-phosphatase family protein n=1 Tax=Eubacterium xylanophilum TaxID=39497 RepID=UPI00047BE7CF|nr:hypothetical protein [Eubacterium xylanophilum]
MIYKKIIFVSENNITVGPMAEWMLRYKLADDKEVCSRGLVVLFQEPMSVKAMDILKEHGIPCEATFSEEFSAEEVTEDTLVLTMRLSEKIILMEEYGIENNVYTIKEFAETEGEIDPRFGGGDEVYEEVYQELVVLLDVIKRKIGWR